MVDYYLPCPCAHPADVVVLDAVDDLIITPAYAYEKPVVLSVDTVYLHQGCI